MKIRNFILAGVAALALPAISGCGEGSGVTTAKSQSSSFAKILETAKAHHHHAATTPTTPTTPSTPTTATGSTTPAPATTPRHTATAPPAAGGFNSIALTSSAFQPGGPIPARYTCDGQSLSPPLAWHGVPPGAAQLFLLVADIGGGASAALQWSLAMPPNTTEIPAGSLPPGTIVGANSLGKASWGAICGQKAILQHITFILYALRHKLNLRPGFDPSALRTTLKGALASGFTVATYQR
ncbi:MAG TPA: YbhB/YbcL family Raf kinase inhibitor-like protein [Solirubrobacteraceae bacterium]|nr:YbhB/YbcL family Raf kinase inhibitor-like protein [Solirubrobacteraceae bacterium]